MALHSLTSLFFFQNRFRQDEAKIETFIGADCKKSDPGFKVSSKNNLPFDLFYYFFTNKTFNFFLFTYLV